MKIHSRKIGPEHPPYVIAEIGVNHDGQVERALMLTDRAADAGADAVKLQYFETDRLMSKAAKLAAYQKDAGETDPIAMLRRLELSLDEMAQVVDRAHQRGIHAIVTVFSVELVELAEQLPWDAYKTASPDLIHRPLLERLMATGKPMIVSTGASSHYECVRALEWLDPVNDLAMLHCVSSYPTALEDAHVGMLRGLLVAAKNRVIGYSDHTTHVLTGHYAVSALASVLEKHITDDCDRPGPDHRASLDVTRFTDYVTYARCERKSIPARVLEQADQENVFRRIWGEVYRRILDCERDVRTISRQSVVSRYALSPGKVLTADDLTFKRPGTGIPPYDIDRVIGRTIRRPVEGDMPLEWEDLEP